MVSDLIGEQTQNKITPDELRLLAIVQRLNPLGVQKVIEYASDLSENEKYTQDLRPPGSEFASRREMKG